MSKQLADADEDYFRNAVASIEVHPDWSVDVGFGVSIDQGVVQAVTETAGAGELRFNHVETEGQLYIRLPDLGSPPGAMEMLLEQPLDPLLVRVDSSIGKEVGEVHQTIADNHATKYITGQSDPYTVLVVSVPVDYCDQMLRETVDAVSTVSRKVAEVHEDIRESINTS